MNWMGVYIFEEKKNSKNKQNSNELPKQVGVRVCVCVDKLVKV